MKTLIKLTIILLIGYFVTACQPLKRNDTQYTFKIEILYTDKVIDTLLFHVDNYKEWELYLELDPETLCLWVKCGFYDDLVACTVRRYKILHHYRRSLNKASPSAVVIKWDR